MNTDLEIITQEIGYGLNETYSSLNSTPQDFVLTGEFRIPEPNEPFLGVRNGYMSEAVHMGLSYPENEVANHEEYGHRRAIVEPVSDTDE